jgi:hypothetical protein
MTIALEHIQPDDWAAVNRVVDVLRSLVLDAGGVSLSIRAGTVSAAGAVVRGQGFTVTKTGDRHVHGHADVGSRPGGCRDGRLNRLCGGDEGVDRAVHNRLWGHHVHHGRRSHRQRVPLGGNRLMEV